MIPLLAMVFAITAPIAPGDDVSPADGLMLTELPPPAASHAPAGGGTTIPWSLPAGLAGVGSVGLAAVGTRTIRRREGDEPIYVLVHGDGGSSEDFDRLMYRMGITEDQTIAFDYRTAYPAETSSDASRRASTAAAAEALDQLIRDLASRHEAVYSIHHSRGGAVGVEMIAALDDGSRPPIDGYRGAALLDPAIGKGLLGSLQRAGGLATFIPDNGGFDPVRCDDSGCRDIRDDLGEASGVEVIAIRNPDAVVTNFRDHPDGLRTYDLVDDGGPSALTWWWNPIWVLGRIFAAHGSVLEHRSVADCVRAESLVPGSCEWTGHRKPSLDPWGWGPV